MKRASSRWQAGPTESAVILDSALPTTDTISGNWRITRAGFDKLFHACAAEAACNRAHSRLMETFTGLVNKLEAEPRTTTVSDPATGIDVKVVRRPGSAHWTLIVHCG